MTFYKWGYNFICSFDGKYYSLEKSSNDSRWEFILEKSFIDSRFVQSDADCFDLPDLTE